MNAPRPLRVLIVDDHEVVREGLRSSLATDVEIEVVGLAATGADAVLRAQRLLPEVAVLDYRLPDFDGDEVCRRIRAVTAGRTRVIFLTSYGSADRIRAAVDAGAFAYLTKADGMKPLRDALHQALATRADESHLEPNPAVHALMRRLKEDARHTDELSLTGQQRRVLELAVEGLTDRDIGVALCVSESTVRYHIQRLKALLGARSKVELVRRAYHHGLAEATADIGPCAAHGYRSHLPPPTHR